MSLEKKQQQQAWDSRYAQPIPHTNSYYSKCAIGGLIACGATHTGVLPLDIVKIRMQVEPEKYKGLLQGVKMVLAEEGPRTLFKGWTATGIGYSLQGLNKFGFYEVFKDVYANAVGEQSANKYKAWIWLGASASAEFVADIFLTPFEMIKVKQQQSKPGTFPSDFSGALREMRTNSAKHNWPYGSLSAVWARQLPYTMAKFSFFELIVGLFYTYVFTNDRNSYSKTTQLGVTFASGYLAGVFCAIVSQVPDALVSLRGKEQHAGKSFGQITKEVGVKKLLMTSLGTRIIMIGSLTGMQWWIYDTYKTMMGLGTSGGGNTSSVKK